MLVFILTRYYRGLIDTGPDTLVETLDTSLQFSVAHRRLVGQYLPQSIGQPASHWITQLCIGLGAGTCADGDPALLASRHSTGDGLGKMSCRIKDLAHAAQHLLAFVATGSISTMASIDDDKDLAPIAHLVAQSPKVVVDLIIG